MSSIAYFTAEDTTGKTYVGQLISTDVAEIRVFIAYPENLRSAIEELTAGLEAIASDLKIPRVPAKKLIVAEGGVNGVSAAQGRRPKGSGRPR